jgi:hypothetical protein
MPVLLLGLQAAALGLAQWRSVTVVELHRGEGGRVAGGGEEQVRGCLEVLVRPRGVASEHEAVHFVVHAHAMGERVRVERVLHDHLHVVAARHREVVLAYLEKGKG